MSTKGNTGKETGNGEGRLKEKYGKSLPFTAPEGYFEDLPSNILERARNTKHAEKSVKVSFSLRPMLAAAAGVVILAGIAAIMLFMWHEPSDVATEDFTYLELYQYNFSNLAELEETYLLSMVSEIADPGLFTPPVDTTGVSREDMIEYLLAENHIEYLTINNNQQ